MGMTYSEYSSFCHITRHEFYYLCELYNFATDYECLAEAEQFLNSEVEK